MSEKTTLKAMPNGPLIAEGVFSVQNAEGAELSEGKTRVALCRCGLSANKPFCDGAHTPGGFKG